MAGDRVLDHAYPYPLAGVVDVALVEDLADVEAVGQLLDHGQDDVLTNAAADPPRSPSRFATGAHPQIRMVGLVERGTHVVFATAVGPLGTGEHALARQVFTSLKPGTFLLADRGFCG